MRIRHVLPGLVGLAACGLNGCAVSPSLNVLGAFFPDWLFCFLAGLLAAVASRFLLIKKVPSLPPGPLPALLYLFIAILASLLVWVVFFQN